MAITISGTDGIVGAGFTVDNSGVSVTAGVGTFSSLQGSGANLTSLPAAQLTGALPAISAANCTNIPAANITGTLPAISGANLTGISGGKILQVQSVTKSDTFYFSTQDTWTDITGLTVDITPANSSNKILIFATVAVSTDNGAHYQLRMEKDGSLIAGGDAAASRTQGFAGSYDAAGSYTVHNNTCNFLDTAGGTSAITYNMAAKISYTTGQNLFINRQRTEAGTDNDLRAISTITLFEVES